ncbi:MAG: putative hydro-lyase [Pseudomonadota bacterium]
MDGIDRSAGDLFDANDPASIRHAARLGQFDGHTSKLAPDRVQTNLVVLPADYAADFLLFCQRNPKPCPLLGVTDRGSAFLPMLGDDIDIRTDVPRYRVWQDGECVEEVTDIRHLWDDSMVGFAIGCSLSFERAIRDAGLTVHHMERDEIVPMYRTKIPTAAAGPFEGPMVVSMRSFSPADAIRAIQITSRFPAVHGAPVHLGYPEQIGISNLEKPDYGPEHARVPDGEIPLFWGCGVTPQSVIRQAKPPICITHAPGHMLVTDRLNTDFAVL